MSSPFTRRYQGRSRAVRPLHVRPYALMLAGMWTVVVGVSLGWNLFAMEQGLLTQARMEARGSSEKDLLLQHWAAEQGGVYVPITERTPPNPNLSHIPERDIETPSGERLTLMNAAYMMRQVYALGRGEHAHRGHFTSLNPIRPENAPDPWEAAALNAFARGEREVSSVSMLDGEPYMRLMRAMVTEERCLKCHAEQGYKVGDVRGGFSVSVPMAPYWSHRKAHAVPLVLGHGLIWMLGLGGLAVSARSIRLRVSEREQAEKEALLSHEMMEQIPDAILLTDLDGTVLRWMGAAEDIFGYSAQEAVGRHIGFLHAPEVRESQVQRIIGVQKDGETFFGTVPCVRKDGTPVPIEMTSRVIYDPEGQPLGLVGVNKDITERKKAEEQQRNLEAQVQHAQKLESLGVLAGGIAHDFNNLLMAILGNADLALDDLSPVAPARESILEIETAARRAADLARQMLAYSGKGRFVVEHIDLSEVVSEMGHLLEVSVAKAVVVQYRLAEALPTVQADVTQLRQVIMNLITNASEAIGDKRGVISVSTGVIRCDRAYLDRSYLREQQPEGQYVYVEVADTGCGMDNGTQEKLFDPFFTTKFTGRGLGMAAVLGIVRGHRGAIQLDSTPGHGTRIRVLFPASDEPLDAIVAEGETRQEWRGTGTVLLVDDEQGVRAVGKRMLERMGFTVLTANDGHEGVNVFREHADHIVCVVMDLSMPRMGGEEAFVQMRAIRKDVRVILSSGYGEQHLTERFVGQGVAAVIQKPYQSAALRAKIEHVLRG